MPKLSPRLSFFLDHLIPGEVVWDLCCDHGLVGLAALKSGLYPEVNFVDCVPHIINRLRPMTITKKAARLHCLNAGDIPEIIHGSVVIAGVGTGTILDILQSLETQDRLQAKRLILSSHKNEKELELFVKYWPRWKVSIEQEVDDRSRSRKVLVLDRLEVQ